jgi:hypothetical protein
MPAQFRQNNAAENLLKKRSKTPFSQNEAGNILENKPVTKTKGNPDFTTTKCSFCDGAIFRHPVVEVAP